MELKRQGKNPFEITKYNRTHAREEVKDNYSELLLTKSLRPLPENFHGFSDHKRNQD